VVKLADGSEVSASQFLEHFMFTADMQYTPVHKLSGGEKRRLVLMMTLIKNPNFLILDEPTNDLDLTTLQKLEEFLESFGGCLILVSHDRFFMDKLVDHYFAFEGDGVIRDFHGTYEEYREMKAEESAEAKRKKSASKEKKPSKSEKKNTKTGNSLSFSERKEFKKLEKQIAELEQEKETVAGELNGTELDYELLTKKSARFEEIEAEIDEKTMRWLELAERDEEV